MEYSSSPGVRVISEILNPERLLVCAREKKDRLIRQIAVRYTKFVHVGLSCRDLPTVIRRFFGDGYIMGVTFLDTRVCNFDELRLLEGF